MEPTVRGLEDIYWDKVTFLRLNAEGDEAAAFKAGNFLGHPAFVLLLPDGQEVWRGVGIVSFEELEKALETVLDSQGE